MKRIALFLLAAAVGAPTISLRAQTAGQRAIGDAVTALGGAKLTMAKSLTIEGDGVNYNLGQDLTPSARSQTFAMNPYKRQLALEGSGRMRIEQTRTPNFTYFGGQQPVVLITGLDGGVAYNVAANGTATRADAAAADRRIEYYHHPVTALRAAQQPNAKVGAVRTEAGQRVVDVETADGVKLAIGLDASNRPVRISSPAYNANLGDVVITSRFSDYQDVSGVKLPAKWTTAVDSFVTAEMQAKQQTVDAAANLAAPTLPAAAGAAPVNVTVEEVAPGVWRLAGGSHHSVVVEFRDHLMLIEAPQSEARALAVIAKARELRPGKPVTQLVNTHHHFDHTAGARGAISEGLTVITQSGNAEFFQQMAKRPHTITRDALTRKPAALKLDPIADAKTFDDGTMTVTVYHVANNPHTQTMLMAHLPKQQLLVEVDAFTPGSAVSPYSPNLLENIRRRNLQIERVIPLHSNPAPFSELVRVASAGQP